MSDLKKIWSNQFLAISAEVNKNTIQTHSSKIEATLKTKPEPITLSFFEDGYSVFENGKSVDEFVVNEFNLCNLVLMELFEQVVFNKNDFSSIDMPENMAKYLIETSKLEKEYTWFDGKLYNNNANKNVYLNRLTVFNEKINSKDAIKANNCLKQIIEETDENTVANLVGSDLRFVGKQDGVKYNEKDIVLNDAVATYTCGRRKVAGLIKHVLNKLNKNERESNEYKLQKLYEMIKESQLNKYEISIVPDEYIEVFTCIPYRINFLSNERVMVSWKELNGSIGNVRNVKPNPTQIISIIEMHEGEK